MIAMVTEAYSIQAGSYGCTRAGGDTGSASVEGELAVIMIVEQMHIKQKNGGKNSKKFLFLHLMCGSLPCTWMDVCARGALHTRKNSRK